MATDSVLNAGSSRFVQGNTDILRQSGGERFCQVSDDNVGPSSQLSGRECIYEGSSDVWQSHERQTLIPPSPADQVVDNGHDVERAHLMSSTNCVPTCQRSDSLSSEDMESLDRPSASSARPHHHHLCRPCEPPSLDCSSGDRRQIPAGQSARNQNREVSNSEGQQVEGQNALRLNASTSAATSDSSPSPRPNLHPIGSRHLTSLPIPVIGTHETSTQDMRPSAAGGGVTGGGTGGQQGGDAFILPSPSSSVFSEPVNDVPLSMLVQAPDGLFQIGTESHGGLPSAKVAETQRGIPRSEQSHDERERGAFAFAPASRGVVPGVEAVHIVMPDTRPQGNSGGADGTPTIDTRTLDALLNRSHMEVFMKRKRAFLFLLVLGSAFYVAAFAIGINHNSRSGASPSPSSTSSGGTGADSNNNNDYHSGGGSTGLSSSSLVDYLAESMLTARNPWVALAYLLLYLSLDMIAFSGALLDNSKLLSLYIVVEAVITCISALEAVRPFLLYRVLIIFLAYHVRLGLLWTQHELRRLRIRFQAQASGNQRPFPDWMETLGLRPLVPPASTSASPNPRLPLSPSLLSSPYWPDPWRRRGNQSRPTTNRSTAPRGGAADGRQATELV
eukprot:TRINITY_DN6170_c0_g1_i2.p1 TRINITY_DN6170_c0_g1~~TRINITY_DN6170_c0_g1_i2.p1  ORF type:complete len:616 (+),score=77.30 TRINITY_DN6170_c0_g1_i2:626-2473(+)